MQEVASDVPGDVVLQAYHRAVDLAGFYFVDLCRMFKNEEDLSREYAAVIDKLFGEQLQRLFLESNGAWDLVRQNDGKGPAKTA